MPSWLSHWLCCNASSWAQDVWLNIGEECSIKECNKSGHKWLTTQSAQISQKQDGCNICLFSNLDECNGLSCWVLFGVLVSAIQPSAWIATKTLWWWPGGYTVFMITYILCPSCFWEIWALCASWITYL